MIQLFFVKAPIEGQVKTRLARFTGSLFATELYRNLLQSVLQGFPPEISCLYVAGEDPDNYFSTEFPRFIQTKQSGEDLGMRMARALLESSLRWPDQPILLTGSDIPQYNLEIAKEAARALETNDMVLIPSKDGGYTTIGIRAGLLYRQDDNESGSVASHFQTRNPGSVERSAQLRQRMESRPHLPGIAHKRQSEESPGPGSNQIFSLFEDIEWSTPTVFAQQMKRIEEANLKVFVMPPMHDLDDARDLFALMQSNTLPAPVQSQARRLPGISVILPVLNEVENLEYVIAPLRECGYFRHIVCADNGSTDGSVEKARSLGVLVSQCSRRGYGSTCLEAMRLLDQMDDWDILLFMDADGSDDPADLDAVLGPVVSGEADFSLGARTRGVLLPHQKFGNWLATFLIRILYGHSYEDLGPFRAIRRSALNLLRMDDPDFGWTVQMQIRALKHRLSVTEVPVMSRKRYAGRSKVSATIRGSVMAGWIILHTVFREFLLNKKESSD